MATPETILSEELTRTGQHYPAIKLNLQQAAATTAPYAFSAVPYGSATWEFNEIRGIRSATLKMNDKPVPIRMICVMSKSISYPIPCSLLPYMDVIPLYEMDAVKTDEAMMDYDGFHPGVDFGWLADRSHHPVRVHIPYRDTRIPGEYYIPPLPPKYMIDIFDNTDLCFDDNRNLVHPDVLKKNDLVIVDCHMLLRADPRVGVPLYFLHAQQIRLVHLASSDSTA